MSCNVQQSEATEALRAALGRMEAALMTRERKLADSWKVLRVHADSLHSGTPNASDSSGLMVSLQPRHTSKHLYISHLAGSHPNSPHEGDAP